MSRTLVLVRHAKAEPAGGSPDHERVLAGKGRKQAASLGPRLAKAVGEVDLALASSAARAAETLERLLPSLKVRERRLVDELYETDPRQVVDLLRGIGDGVRTVLVVGHEPTVSQLATLLDGERGDLARQASIGVPTATACVLEVPGSWAELDRGAARLTELLRPSE